MTISIPSKSALPKAAEKLIQIAGDKRKILLYGEMGAGKTTFAKAFCQVLGVKDITSSPTYSLVNEYSYINAMGVEAFVHHIDLYRLKSLQEALDIGIDDYLYDPNFTLIEWPQIIEPILPDNMLKIVMQINQHSGRKIVVL